jgi:hypothetical protein
MITLAAVRRANHTVTSIRKTHGILLYRVFYTGYAGTGTGIRHLSHHQPQVLQWPSLRQSGIAPDADWPYRQ